MHETLTPDQLLRLLGYAGGDKVERKHVEGSAFEAHPGSACKLGSAMAKPYVEDHIATIVGYGLRGFALSLFVAQSLRALSAGTSTVGRSDIAVVPVDWDWKAEDMVISQRYTHLVEGQRILVVAALAGSGTMLRRVAELCRKLGAKYVALAVIANYGCSPDDLAVDKIRSLT